MRRTHPFARRHARDAAIARLGSIFSLITGTTIAMSIATFGVMAREDGRRIAATPPLVAAIGDTLASGAMYRVADPAPGRISILRHMISTADDQVEAVLIADETWRYVNRDLGWPGRFFNAWMPDPDAGEVSDLVGDLLDAGPPRRIILALSRSMMQEQPLRRAGERLAFDLANAASLPVESGPSISTSHPLLETLLPDGSVTPPARRQGELESVFRPRTISVSTAAISDLARTVQQILGAGVSLDILIDAEIEMAMRKQDLPAVDSLLSQNPGGDTIGQATARVVRDPTVLSCTRRPTPCRILAVERAMTALNAGPAPVVARTMP
ncbi:MAG: hypothetical protein AAF334_04810 [Pseudomonadota bacterium]